MFKNFQEHYERPEESRFSNDLRAFNTKYDRLKLILSAILIPVGCSFFYFKMSGHKYAELESAIGNIEIVQDQARENQLADTVTLNLKDDRSFLANSDSRPEERNVEINEPDAPAVTDHLVRENVVTLNDSQSDVTQLSAETVENPGTVETANGFGSAIAETAPENTSIQLNSGDLIPDVEKAQSENKPTTVSQLVPGRNLAELSDLLITVPPEEFIAGRAEAELALLVHTQDSSTMPDIRADIPAGPNQAAQGISVEALQENEQAKIVMVDQIIGLLKSEIINTHASADAGKRKSTTNRHTTLPAKKLYDVNKLESILEDI